MRSKQFMTVGLVAAVAVVQGCAMQPQTPAQLTDRLNNAQQIGDITARDSSLKQIAIDSADSNVPSVCQSSLSAMNDSTVRDQTAQDCANTFDGRGDRTSAEAMVSLINDGNRRDNMRAKFAANPMKTPADMPTTRP